MSIIQVYKCDVDGKLFQDRKKYIKHLKVIAGDNRMKRLEKKLKEEKEIFLDKMGQVSSITELENFIRDNWKWFVINGSCYRRWDRLSNNEFHEYVEVSFQGLRWSETVSNSHSCPRLGVENFDTRAEYNAGKPTAYPGWQGSITIRVKPPLTKYKGKEYLKDGWGGDYFAETSINTGSGGGGHKNNLEFVNYSYDVKLFAADFPVMYREHRRQEYITKENLRLQKIWKAVGGNNFSQNVVTDIPEDWEPVDPLKGTRYASY